jgi:predicted heme/steroid binding protein
MTYPALEAAVYHCIKSGIQFPDEFWDWMAAKTEGYYSRVLTKAVRDLYNGKISDDDFLGIESRLLDGQIQRAWNEGMRAVGLDPAKDLTDAMEAQIKDIQDSEFSYLQGFIDAIDQARTDGTDIQTLLNRADMWSAQYSTTESMAEIFCAPDDLNFFWHYGQTEEHCEDCAMMVAAGVQSAVFWREKQTQGIYPQSPQLACHGFHCDCGLDSTDDPVEG